VEVVVPEGETAEAGDLALESIRPAEFPPPPRVDPPAIPYGRLSGTARDPSGRPLAGWWIGVRPASATDDPGTLHGRVDYRGAFAIVLPPGEYRVALIPAGKADPAAETTATVPEGGEVAVEFHASR
jgi:hypothetical protein